MHKRVDVDVDRIWFLKFQSRLLLKWWGRVTIHQLFWGYVQRQCWHTAVIYYVRSITCNRDNNEILMGIQWGSRGAFLRPYTQCALLSLLSNWRFGCLLATHTEHGRLIRLEWMTRLIRVFTGRTGRFVVPRLFREKRGDIVFTCHGSVPPHPARYLVWATPHTVLCQSFWNFRGVCHGLKMCIVDCWPDMPDLPPPGEFGRHTLSSRPITSALNERCLHSVSGGLSVWQPVTYVTPAEIGKIKLKFVA